MIARAGGTITIAMTFIVLIVMFGVLSVVTVVSGWRGHLALSISTAAWLTSSVFALIPLRHSLPGHPPLGCWMDVLADFWVIAVVMVMIGATVVTVVAARPEEPWLSRVSGVGELPKRVDVRDVVQRGRPNRRRRPSGSRVLVAPPDVERSECAQRCGCRQVTVQAFHICPVSMC